LTRRSLASPLPYAAAWPASSRARQLAGMLVAAGFWAAFASLVTVHTYLSMLSHGHSFARLLGYQLAACAYWVLATPVIALLARRFGLVPPSWRALLVHLLGATVSAAGYVAWLMYTTLRLRPFGDAGARSFAADFTPWFNVHFPLQLLVYGGTLGAVYAFDFHARAVRAAELQREVAAARLAVLTAQLRPHFLFNALHTVSALIRVEQPHAAITTIAGLSELLRYTLDGSGSHLATLGEELAMIRRYLAIEELRRGAPLRVTLDVDDEATAGTVPRLLLQPLVENSLRHGLAAGTAAAWMELHARRNGDLLHIGIDNAARFEPHPTTGFGIGLQNTRARLAQIYGDRQRLEVRRLADRFELAITLPWQPAAAGPDEHG
jgi:two-component system, LytTR family, sensor kinase